MREIILDTETTGLDPKTGHRIIEIGALEMRNKILTGSSFHYYINPEREVPFEAFKIHGISSEFLKDKPKFHEISVEFLEFIEGANLVIHNASFDMNFLNHELTKIGQQSLDFVNVVDTLILARKMFPGQKNNLDSLCKRFNVDNSDRKYHGALKDSVLLAEVYVELTGGRQTILAVKSKESIAREESKTSKENSSKFSYENLNFKIIEPTKIELEKHEEFLGKLKN